MLLQSWHGLRNERNDGQRTSSNRKRTRTTEEQNVKQNGNVSSRHTNGSNSKMKINELGVDQGNDPGLPITMTIAAEKETGSHVGSEETRTKTTLRQQTCSVLHAFM